MNVLYWKSSKLAPLEFLVLLDKEICYMTNSRNLQGAVSMPISAFLLKHRRDFTST